MIEAWSRPVEQVLLAAEERKARTLGIVSPEPQAGVSALSRCLAETSARAGKKTLLLDLSQRVLTNAKGGWRIGDGTAQIIKSLPERYDVMDVRPTIESRSAFNNAGAMRQLLNEDLQPYEQVILDLPAVLHGKQDFVNPMAAARACDLVMLLCVPGKTSSGNLDQALSAFETGGVSLGGLVLNDDTNPTLGEQIAGSAGNLTWLSRRISSWLQRKARAVDLLNLRG